MAAAEKLTTLGRPSFEFLSANVDRLSETFYKLFLSWGRDGVHGRDCSLLTQALASGVPAKKHALSPRSTKLRCYSLYMLRR